MNILAIAILSKSVGPNYLVYSYLNCLPRLHGEGNGSPLQYSCLENPVDGGALRASVHRVVESRTRRSDFTFTFHFHALEKAMAAHSSVLAWRIPGAGEPGGLPSKGSHRVGHDRSDVAAAAAGLHKTPSHTTCAHVTREAERRAGGAREEGGCDPSAKHVSLLNDS